MAPPSELTDGSDGRLLLRAIAAARSSRALRRLTYWALDRAPALRAPVQRLLTLRDTAEYRAWAARYDTLTDADRAMIRTHAATLPARTISVVMPVFNPRENWFRAAIQSVRGQLYPHWELCIADDASTAPHVARVLAEFAADSRIRVVRRAENGHISRASNSALALATGEFVALMDHDDLLAEHALYRVAVELATFPDADLVYSDEDLIDARGRRLLPHFKPDWDLDLQLGQNMVCHLAVYRRTLMAELGGLRAGFEGSQDHDLVLRVAERTTPARIRHIPAVLYHWRRPGHASFSERAAERCAVAARRAVAEHFARIGEAGVDVQAHPRLQQAVRVVRRLPDPPPLVSAIVPTRDGAALLERCADGLLRRTAYPNLEVLIVDNGSTEPSALALLRRLATDPRVRVLRVEGPFNFAALNNRAAAEAAGAVLLLLNNDIEIIAPDWLTEMVSHALRPEIGAVGAKLLYPDGRVQHAGVVLGFGHAGVAGHIEAMAARDALGYGSRLHLVRQVAAVTAACMAVRRGVFLDAGGLDAANLAVAFNDVDFCLRLRERGLRIVWTPFAELFHHESATRGSDEVPATAARFAREAEYMRRRWGPLLDDDPFYNPNFSLAASYRLGEPRRTAPWLQRPSTRSSG
jgi:GT2 family glycosyltransferase